MKRFLFFKLIPKGNYCYSIKKIDWQNGCVKTKLCPFYEFPSHHLEQNSKCTLINLEDDVLLDDQVKRCGINID